MDLPPVIPHDLFPRLLNDTGTLKALTFFGVPQTSHRFHDFYFQVQSRKPVSQGKEMNLDLTDLLSSSAIVGFSWE